MRKSLASTSIDQEDDAGPAVVARRRSKLSRPRNQQNADDQLSGLTSASAGRQSEPDEQRPVYNQAHLQQLKASTPSTPRDLTTDVSASELDTVADTTRTLDLSSKFGPSLSRYQQSSAIPSATEIAAKKARRARLAKEQAAEEYISLDPSDPELDQDEDDNVTKDERGRLVLKPKDKYGELESRLVRDDEDLLENFDDFTEAQGKILMGRKDEAEEASRKRVDMAAQIAAAEGQDEDDSDSDASERERNNAFEAAQTQRGTYQGARDADSEPDRPRTPPILTPLPTLDAVISRLQQEVADMQTARMRKLQEMDTLKRERIRLSEEEVRIQAALKETAEKFSLLRAKKGLEGSNVDKQVKDGVETNASLVLAAMPSVVS